jgi:two-component system, OmpR family, sensor histidine kinase MtrB
MRFPRRARLGLRARITLVYGLGALLLSTMLASITWGLTRENLLNQRDDAAVERVVRNAVFISDKIGPEDVIQQTLAGVSTPEGSTPLVRVRGEWHAVNPVLFQADDVAPGLLDSAEQGLSARMRYDSRNGPILVVGVPILEEDALYFESVSLEELQDTMNGLGIVLLGAALVTTLAGFALGYYASGRVLRPLTEVGEAAQAIAGGRFDTRIEAEDDPDLRPFSESFNAMAQALQERVERDARFASEVSHELRSPLMTLMASIEVLQNTRDDLPDRAQTAVDLLLHDIERFQQLVEDLLEISRFDAGAVRLDLSEVFAAEMVERAVGALVGRSVPVVVDMAAAEAVVRVDKRRMGQVIANLLDNAQKYADGARLISVETTDEHVRIAVEDDGPGVPEEEREVIFDRFSRGSAGGRRGDDFGTGLGLALIREHLHLHLGRIWVEDRPNGQPGARFVIELPLVAEDGSTEGPELTDDEELPLDQVPAEPTAPENEEIVT